MKTLILLSALLALISGCVLPPSGKMTTSQMGATMQYRGFSVKRPDDLRWYALKSEHSPHNAIFRINTKSPTHSFFAEIKNKKIAIQPRTIEEFKTYIDKENLAMGPRHESLSYQSKAIIKQGQWTVAYVNKSLDKAAINSDSTLVMKMTGYTILHPTWDRTVIDVMYSERGLPEEVDGTFDPIGKAFINGVVIESEPKIPTK